MLLNRSRWSDEADDLTAETRDLGLETRVMCLTMRMEGKGGHDLSWPFLFGCFRNHWVV